MVWAFHRVEPRPLFSSRTNVGSMWIKPHVEIKLEEERWRGNFLANDAREEKTTDIE